MAKKLYGTDPDQVPTNADLGTMAYQDSDNAVMVDPLFQHSDTRQAKFKRVDGAWSTIEITAGDSNGNSRIAFTSPDTEDQIAQNTADGMIDYEHNTDALRFYTNKSLAAQFTSSGNLLFPDGQGIDFSSSEGSGATSSILDDYEEGTWTPTLLGTTTAGTWTSSGGTPNGRYTKIGSTYVCTFELTGTLSGASGDVQITGLPAATSANDQGWYATWWNGFNTAIYYLYGHITNSGAGLWVKAQTGATTTAGQLTTAHLGTGNITIRGVAVLDESF